MEGANWDKLEGGPSRHVVVNASEPHRTNYTMYGKIVTSFNGKDSWRWNMANVAGCNVGPMRTVSAMRPLPWHLPIAPVPDSKIHAVILRPRHSGGNAPPRVAVVDGVVQTGSDEWRLVGVEMVVSVMLRSRARMHSDAPALLPFVAWPPTVMVGGVEVVSVKPLQWGDVMHPAMLIAHTIGHVDVAPSDRKFGLVDPGTSFAMVPVTVGRMRARMGALLRVMELNSLADIASQIGRVKDDETGFHESSAATEFLNSVRSIQKALADAQQEDVYEALLWLGSWRPETNTHAGQLRRVSRGLLPAGCYHLAQAIAQCRRLNTTGFVGITKVLDTTGFIELPHGMHVLDVGSGDGVVVLCLGAMGASAGWEVRGIELPCVAACDHHSCALGAWSQWIRAMYETDPLLHSIAEAASKAVVSADATSDTDDVARLWQWADVIFMNNLCFDSETVGAIGGCQVTTMTRMMHTLLQHGEVRNPPTLVITTTPLHRGVRTPNHTTNARHDPYGTGTKQVRMIRTFAIPRAGYDWGQDGATLQCFVHVLESVEPVGRR